MRTSIIAGLFPILVVWAVIGLTVGRSAAKSKKAQQEQARPQNLSRNQVLIQAPKAPAAGGRQPGAQAVRRPTNAGEGHVATIGPDKRAQLEQLDTLKNAGILDPEEYTQKKRQLLG